MGSTATMILGVIGSFAGGTIGSLLFGDGGSGIQPGSWISSILGAMLVLFLYSKFAQKARGPLPCCGTHDFMMRSDK